MQHFQSSVRNEKPISYKLILCSSQSTKLWLSKTVSIIKEVILYCRVLQYDRTSLHLGEWEGRLSISFTVLKMVNNWTRAEIHQKWLAPPSHILTKCIIKTLNSQLNRSLIRLNWEQFRIVVTFLTGHDLSTYQQWFTQWPKQSVILQRGQESSQHNIFDCEMLEQQHRRLFEI